MICGDMALSEIISFVWDYLHIVVYFNGDRERISLWSDKNSCHSALCNINTAMVREFLCIKEIGLWRTLITH